MYEGVHSKIGRLGAIKVLKLEFCRSEDVVERFYQEARAVNMRTPHAPGPLGRFAHTS